MTDERRGVPSASGLERVALCPGSWPLEQQCPPEEELSFAAEGTLIHSVLAGEIPGDALTADQQWVVDQCRDLEERVVASFGMDDAEIEREVRLWFDDPAFSGKPDAIYRLGGKILCLDYKSGRGAVPSADGNWQMRALAVLAARHYGATEVLVAIIQPRAKESLTICQYNESSLRQAEQMIAGIVRDSLSTDAPRVPGDKQCRYCRAKSICPEIRNEALSIITPEALVAGSVTLPALTGEQLAEILPKCDLAEQVIKGAREQAKNLLASGGDIPGYGLKEGASRREIPDAQKAFAALDDIITPAEFQAVCSVGLSKLEKLYGEKVGLTGGALRNALATRLGDAIQAKPAAAPTLVRTT